MLTLKILNLLVLCHQCLQILCLIPLLLVIYFDPMDFYKAVVKKQIKLKFNRILENFYLLLLSF